MKVCEFLSGRQIKMCGAFNSALVMSLEELESQCQTNHYHTCKLYQKYLKKGVKLPLQEYNKNYVLPSV